MIIKMNGYSPSVSREEIANLFRTYGRVQNVIVTSNGAYVRMPNTKRAKIAINNLNGMKWKGWRISLSKTRSEAKTSLCRTSLGMFRMF